MEHYEVQVYTGDHWAAATDANAYIILWGSKGDSGKRTLYKSDQKDKFLRNQVHMIWYLEEHHFVNGNIILCPV